MYSTFLIMHNLNIEASYWISDLTFLKDLEIFFVLKEKEGESIYCYVEKQSSSESIHCFFYNLLFFNYRVKQIKYFYFLKDGKD